jgi:hypothetical protein
VQGLQYQTGRPSQHAGCSYRALLAWIVEFGEVARVGVEGTGSYGAGLTPHLVTAGVPRGHRPCPTTTATSESRSMLPTLGPMPSARRIPPGSSMRRTSAVSRSWRKSRPFAGFQQLAQVLDRHDRDGLLGHGRRADRAHPDRSR